MTSDAGFAFADSPPDDRAGTSPRGLGWPFVAWSIPLWWATWGIGWWRVSARQLEHVAALDATFAAIAPGAASLAVLARSVGLLVETGFYAAFWRTRGVTLPFWRYAFHLMLGSLLDLQAIDLAAAHGADAPLSPWRVALAGPAAAPRVFALAHPVWVAAFASAGLVTLTRWVWVAWAQAEAARCPIRGPLALTVATWLVTHLAMAATAALMQGRSVLP